MTETLETQLQQQQDRDYLLLEGRRIFHETGRAYIELWRRATDEQSRARLPYRLVIKPEDPSRITICDRERRVVGQYKRHTDAYFELLWLRSFAVLRTMRSALSR